MLMDAEPLVHTATINIAHHSITGRFTVTKGSKQTGM